MCKKLAILPVLSIIIAFLTPHQAFASYPSVKPKQLAFEMSPGVNLNYDGFIESQEKEPEISEIKEKTAEIAKEPIKCAKEDSELGSCRTFKVTVTGYSSTIDQCDADPFTTASGKHVRHGTLATNSLSFGTLVKFPEYFGDRVFIVEDRMNKRYSSRMDIWFESRSEALQFGKRTLIAVVIN